MCLRPAEIEASESQSLQKPGGKFSKINVLVDFLKMDTKQSSFHVPKTFSQFYRSLQQSVCFSGRWKPLKKLRIMTVPKKTVK